MTIAPMPGAPTAFPFDERRVRVALGINKDEARELRGQVLREGQDWVRHKKHVVLSPRAVERLELALAEKPAPWVCAPQGSNAPAGDPLKSAPPEKPAVRIAGLLTEGGNPVERLRVVRSNLANRHLVLACPAADDPDRPARTFRVRVKDPGAFRRREVFDARLIEGHTDYYELAGPAPRRKGAA